MTKLLITGGDGMVGSYAAEVFAEHRILSTDLGTMDIGSPQAVSRTFKEFGPEVVLHLAAATDVDRCEQDPDWAFRSNAVGTENIALACREAGAALVYVSSGAVFKGDKPTPYTEFDLASPSNVYAASKLAGEEIVRRLVERHYIVRAGWVFGGGKRDKKFVGKLASLIFSGKTELKVVDDKVGTPTYAKDFLRGIKRLLSAGRGGLYHMGNEGAASRYQIALEIARLLGKENLPIKPVSSEHFPLPAPRGASEAISNYKLKLLGLPPQRPWQEALADYLESELALSPQPAAKA